jgi:tRNA (guanine-N7-)-methyltransferase
MSISRVPTTAQTGIHPKLDERVRRHLESEWQQPLRRYSLAAFESVRERGATAASVVLDSGCGTGESSMLLSARHPGELVIGIDKSASRLGRAPALSDEVVLVRAELADLWRLAQRAQWPISHHYLLYPNPWPKPEHLQRRWHAHPVFPVLLNLGGTIILRTNFEIYAVEFLRALQIAGVTTGKVVSLRADDPLSPFERKYAASGHSLFELTAQLRG